MKLFESQRCIKYLKVTNQCHGGVRASGVLENEIIKAEVILQTWTVKGNSEKCER